MSPELLNAIAIFVLAILVGFEVISKVPATLHTPLMSGANSIHGIVIVGAMLIAAAADNWFSYVLAFRKQLPGIRTLPTCANALITLAFGNETRGTRLTRRKESLKSERPTRCREGTCSGGLDLAGRQGFEPR